MSYNTFTYSSHPRKRHNPEWLDTRDDNDHIYYNVTIRHSDAADPTNPNIPVIASFEEERVQPIIDNPNDYYLTITRFTVPGGEIPIFLFPIQPFPNTNPNLSNLSVTLEYNGDIQQQFLIYDPRNNVINPPPAPTANNPEWARTEYYYVFTYDHMIQMINDALKTAFGNLAAPPLASVAPYFCYDSKTQLISLYCQRAYYDENLASPIQIYVNTPLLNYLEAIDNDFFGYNNADGRDFRFTILDNPCNYYQNECEPSPVESSIITNIPLGGPGSILITTSTPHGLSVGDMIEIIGSDSNPVIDGVYSVLTAPSATTFTINVNVAVVGVGGEGFAVKQCNLFKIEQDYNSLYRWNSFKDIVFKTNTIPIVNEYIRSNAAGQVNFQPILTDFEPLLSKAGDSRSNLQYFPQGPYRLINLNSSVPLKKFDVSVFWKDEKENLYPIRLFRGQVLTIKFLFIKK